MYYIKLLVCEICFGSTYKLRIAKIYSLTNTPIYFFPFFV